MSEVRCVLDAHATLAEGPVWDVEEQALYWVDILNCKFNRLDPTSGENRTWIMPEHISSYGLRAGGGAIVALRTGIHFFDFETEALEPIADPEADNPGTRFSDGKVDRRGRFWAGTIPYEQFEPICNLYRFDPGGHWQKMQDNVIVSNGLGWSPDNRTMYYTDTFAYQLYAYDFDAESGSISNRRVFAEIPGDIGFPDGMTVDSEGYIWSAIFDGGRINRYAPDGRLDRVLELPVMAPTSCMFGGPDLGTLYITSSGKEVSPKGEDFKVSPHDGGIFAAEVGIKGLPETRFAG